MKTKEQVIVLLYYLIAFNLIYSTFSEELLDLDGKLDNIIQEQIESTNQNTKKETKSEEITDSIKDLLEDKNDNTNNGLKDNELVEIKISDNNSLANESSYDNNNNISNKTPLKNGYKFNSSLIDQFQNQVNNVASSPNQIFNDYNQYNQYNPTNDKFMYSNINMMLGSSSYPQNNQITNTNNIQNHNSEGEILSKPNKLNSTSSIKSVKINPELQRIRRLFEIKIKNTNSKNYFSKSILNNDSTILKHVYLGSNSPLEKTWKYDVENESFIVPSEVQNEDDWNKFLRILSLLDSMEFDNVSEKEQRKIISIANPPIVMSNEKPQESGNLTSINIDKQVSDEKERLKKEEKMDDSENISFISLNSRLKKRRNRNNNEGDNKIVNPPNFLMDI